MPRLPSLLLCAVVAAGCAASGAPGSPGPSASPIDPEGSWTLREGTHGAAAVPVVADAPITLTIAGSEVHGRASCNSYGARITVIEGRVRFAEMGMTAMACEGPVMRAEEAYMAALTDVETVDLRDGDLILAGDGVELRFEALPPPPTAELVDTDWTLAMVLIGDVAAAPIGNVATLALRSDGTLSGSTGCRGFEGRWIEQGEQILATTLGMTDVACPPDVAGQDGHVVGVVGDGFVPTVEGNLLTLIDPGGIGLVYEAAE